MLAWIEFLTHLLNQWFAAPVDALLAALHIHILHPAAPIENTLTEELIVFGFLILFFMVVRLTLSVEKPGSAQHLMEYIHEFVEGQASQVMGHGHDPHLPILTCFLLFILLCNCFGLLLPIETPTSNPIVPLGLALCAFVYYNWQGFRAKGPIRYVKHFMGPVPWMAWMMFPIEVFSNFIRILSLTVRLYANMLASDLITLVFFSLVPFALPVVGLGLHLFVACIQAYIFMLLTSIYLAEATAQEDH